METEGEEMSRYIDADEAFNLLADAPQAIVPKVIWKVGIRSILDQCNAIDIVRCKECRWRNDYGCHNPIWGDGWANYLSPSPREDDFCSYGERKESE